MHTVGVNMSFASIEDIGACRVAISNTFAQRVYLGGGAPDQYTPRPSGNQLGNIHI